MPSGILHIQTIPLENLLHILDLFLKIYN
jgi:hypothetical protein